MAAKTPRSTTLLSLGMLLSSAIALQANTLTVSTTADTGAGSLRQAILDANAGAGGDTIAFNIAGAGPYVILPQAPGPFTAASIAGSYLGTQLPGGSYSSTSASGVATSAGGGTLATTLDLNAGGAVSTESATATLTVESTGRATDSKDRVVYIVSPTRFFVMPHRDAWGQTTSYPVVQLFEQ